MKVTPEIEEVCNWWAQVQGSDFAEQENVIKNFTESFCALFDPSLGATSLGDFDFTKIKEHLDNKKEERNARPTEEKKRELAEKQENERIFKYCLIDYDAEKISNFMVEPPGIFRGRGEHPHAGRLKKRIVPEMV